MKAPEFDLPFHVLILIPHNREKPFFLGNIFKGLQASTFGLYVLNCCVRYGNRWNHIGIITGLLTCPRSKPERVQLIRQQVVRENVPRVKPEGRRRLADVDRCLRDPSSLKTIQKKLLWNILGIVTVSERVPSPLRITRSTSPLSPCRFTLPGN